MRWNVRSTFYRKYDPHVGYAGRVIEAPTATEAFVIWRRRRRFKLSKYEPGEVLVSVFPIFPSRAETQAQVELLAHKRVDFDLLEDSLSILAIEASMRKRRKQSKPKE